MTDDDIPKFAATIAALAFATRAELDDPTIEMYFSTLKDVPMPLLHAASVEWAKVNKFFPRPSEWREAVDTILDRQDRLTAGAPHRQQQLPGDIGDRTWICPDCDNTGWAPVTIECARGGCLEAREDGAPHTHAATTRCSNTFCRTRREHAAARKRRYAKGE